MDRGKHPDTRPPIPDLRPPGTALDPAAAPRENHAWIWPALGLLAGLGLAVVLLLPQLVSTPPAAEPAATPPAAQVAPAEADGSTGAAAEPTAAGEAVAADPAGAGDERRRAELALQDYLKLQARLELANAPAWGEPEWSRAATAAADGDRLFGQREFALAAERYAGARGTLQALEAGRETRLAAALTAGEAALQGDDGDTAIAQFERALEIEAGNATAMAGLQRARARPALLKSMQAGVAAEATGDLAAAEAAYAAAARGDPRYAPAADALARVRAARADAGYRDAMNRALAALEAGRLREAGRALEEAAARKPGDPVVGDTRRRLAAARREARLAGLRRQAADAVRDENWSAAAGRYREALAIDPHAGFATDGLAQAEDRVRLHGQLDHYLADPARVYSAGPLANAEAVLAAAGQAPAGEPRLAEKIGQLRQRVAEARVPLPVNLRSDGQTRVVIYHVGELGVFSEHRLELTPGTYTAVGSRTGYRDVRRTFTVQPGRALPVIDIRCEEPV